MSASRLEMIIRAGVAEGILPPDASAVPQPQRPWPVIVLTALGGWLAALPLLAAVVFLFDDYLRHGAGPYIVGVASLTLTVFLLRRKDTPLFLEQLAIPLMLAGGGAIAFGLDNDVPNMVLFSLMCILALGVAAAVPQGWLRTLLGAVACSMALCAITFGPGRNESAKFILALYVTAALWAGIQFVKPRLPTDEASLDAAHALDAVSTGWCAATLAGLAIYSGSTFLVSSIVPGDDGGFGLFRHGSVYLAWQAVSAVAAAGAAFHLARAWPSLNRPWAVAAALVAIFLSAFMPSLGATLLILSLYAIARRWAMTGAAGLAAAWIIGAFYYQLSLPLADKALIMLGAGIVMGGSAWLALRGNGATAAPPVSARRQLRAAAGIAVTAVAVLAVANGAIWQKEDIIANGKPVFIELAPVDPRSLMQGDYMNLNFVMPPAVERMSIGARQKHKLLAVGKIDARGVLTITRPDDGTALAIDELHILVKTDGINSAIATDAWYFREGEAEHFAKARYGEFRVLGNGRALLVGLRGPHLEKL